MLQEDREIDLICWLRYISLRAIALSWELRTRRVRRLIGSRLVEFTQVTSCRRCALTTIAEDGGFVGSRQLADATAGASRITCLAGVSLFIIVRPCSRSRSTTG